MKCRDLRRDPLFYAVVVFAVAFCAPLFRWVLWLGDEGVIVHAAVRLLGGQTPYRDFFAIQPPGSFVIVAGWMKVLGTSFVSVRSLAVVTITAIAVLTYIAARLTARHRVVAFAIAIVWIVGASLDINHHTFTTAASMLSGISLMIAVGGAAESRVPFFAAGLFAGVASMITQTRGTFLALAVVMVVLSLPNRVRLCVPVLIGALAAPAATMIYLAAAGALGAAVENVIAFPFRHYAGIQGVPFGAFATPAEAGVVALFPLTFVLAVAAGGMGAWRTPAFRAAAALAVVGFLGAFPRPDVTHLAFVIPLAAPLLALAVSTLLAGPGSVSARWGVGAALVIVWLWHMSYGIAMRVNLASLPRQAIMTARGLTERPLSVWTTDFGALVGGIERYTRGDEGFFFYPYMPMLPYLTARRHVGRLDVMVPGYTTPDQFAEVCASVVAEAQWVVIDHGWVDSEFLLGVFPAIADANPPEKRAFEAMLTQAFDRVHTSHFFEVRRRTARAVPALCEGITPGGA